MPNDQNRESYLRIIERRADIGGRFFDIKRIGGNGGDGYFSLLLSARDSLTAKRVAIKVFNPTHRNDAYRWQCFQREADILETLRGHRDIIESVSARAEFTERLDAGGGIVVDLPFSYYALELAAGDVANAIANEGFTTEQSLAVFHQMCRALQRIHARGIVHRDLKPGNFLLMPNGELRLSDFGTARNLRDGSGAILSSYSFPPGDLRYSSPEMLASIHDHDPQIAYRGDVFSLGCILFELLTGTVLGIQLFDQQFKADLAQAMGAVGKEHRQRIFHEFLTNIVGTHPLPHLGAFQADVPSSLLPELDGLYKSMAALDHRQRICDYERIFLRLDRCIWILRNQENYRRWRARREQFRRMHEQKLARREAVRNSQKASGK